MSLRKKAQLCARSHSRFSHLLHHPAVDLVFRTTITQITHDSKIDWLELNETGHKLLYRDKKMRLTLLDTRTGENHSILTYCTFVQVGFIAKKAQSVSIVNHSSRIFAVDPRQ